MAIDEGRLGNLREVKYFRNYGTAEIMVKAFWME